MMSTSKQRARRPVALAIALTMVLAGVLLGQSNQGTIAGTISDASGAVVPGAKITAREVASGTAYNTVSSSAGTYIFPNVRIGTYDISVEYSGFSTWKSTGVVVQINSTTSLNVTLQPGEVTQTVEVSGGSPTVQSDTSDIGTVVTEKQILDLPLALGSVVQAMRSPEAFVFLTPGTVGPGTANGNGGTFESKINGGQNYSTEVLFDGASTSRSENGSSFDETAPSVDALGEFRVITSTLPAEMGRTSGGIESFGTKSGTNSIHGSAFDIFRNEKLDANSFFNNLNGGLRPLDKQNDYGLTFGGPVWIPKVYNGKDKTFFFFSWEQYRQNQGGVSTSTVPTAAEKTGDFSAQMTNNVLGTNPCDGSNIYTGEIFDPTTTKTVNGVQCRTLYSGNKIPQSLISPIAQKILSFYPDPLNGNSINNYSLAFSFPILDTSMSIRIDENLSSKSKLFFSYASRDNTRTSTTPVFDNAGGAGRDQDFFTHYVRLGHDYVITPTLLNHLNLGYNRTNSKNVGAGVRYGKDWNQELGIKGADGKTFPVIGVVEGPMTWLGDDVNGDTIDNGYRLNESIDWVKGKHTLKFGTDLRYQRYSPLDFSRAGGNYYFWRQQTAGTPLTSGLSGNAVASLLLGLVHDSNLLQKAGQPLWLSSYSALFVQDSFKVTRTLTLNLGFRWEVDMPRREAFGNTSNLSLTTPNPGANGQLGALVFAGTGQGRNGNVNERWANTYMKDFSPRFGFAWAPAKMSGKTVVRGGFGIYYGPLLYADFGGFNRVGFQANPGFSSLDGFSPAFNINSGFPAFTPAPNLNPAQLNYTGGVQYTDPSFGRPPMVTNWSFQIQQQLATDLMLEVGYVGSHGTHLRTNFDAYNSLTPNYLGLSSLLSQQISSPQAQAAGIKSPFASFPQNAIVGQALVPFPQYFGFNTDGTLENLGQSSYNSLQASLQRRFHNGLNLMAAYTWSKTLTDADSALPFFATLHGGGSAQNPFNLKGEKSLSNQDVPQMLVLSYVYQLPVGKGKKFLARGGVVDKVAGGWEVSGIQRYQSGQPLSFCCATGIPAFAGSIRFDQVSQQLYSQQFLSGHFNPVTDPMFNRAAFLDPNQPSRIQAGGGYVFGSMTRTEGWARMPRFLSEDFNVQKRASITEKVNAVLQVSFLNAFNRHIFNRPPDLNANDPQFGILNTNSVLYPPRRVQLQLKLTW